MCAGVRATLEDSYVGTCFYRFCYRVAARLMAWGFFTIELLSETYEGRLLILVRCLVSSESKSLGLL